MSLRLLTSIGKKARKRLGLMLLSCLLVINIATFAGAYGLTHYREPGTWGLGETKPYSAKVPSDFGLNYQTQQIAIGKNEWIETWSIPATDRAKGTVLLFPGKGGCKACQLIAPALVFHELGYDTLLVDPRGVGGASGHTTTVGMREAEDVAASVDYARSIKLPEPYVLYGISMNSTAIMKAVAEAQTRPDAIMLELPFYRLVDAVGIRLESISLPRLLLAELTVFWGNVQLGVNGFAHNPIDYATQIKIPTLILHGELDTSTSVDRVKEIFNNLRGIKQLDIFPQAKHDLLVTIDRRRWMHDVDTFLSAALTAV
jgi:uncharacterized protein